MPTIYIAGNRIVPFLPGPVLTPFGHLQLVYDGFGGLVELEVQSQRETGSEPAPPLGNPFWGSWRFENLNEDHIDPNNTYNYGVDGYYVSTAIDIGERTAGDVWGILEQVQRSYISFFGNLSPISYDVNFNSNSWVNTLLHVVGLRASDYVGALDFGNASYTVTPDDGSAPYEVTVGYSGYPGHTANALTRENALPLNNPAVPLDLVGTPRDDIIRTGFASDRIRGFEGNDELWGFGGDDRLIGGLGNDTLIGGLGADELRGGAGDDWLFFDFEDTVVLGGGGRDRAYAQGTDPVTLDLTAAGIEIAVGTTPEDGIAGDTFLNARRGHMVAGGGGDDYVSVTRGTTGAPTVLWGGEGADTLVFLPNEEVSRPLGLMFVTAEGLTEETFAEFTRDLIDAPARFRWANIDAIILNPDAEDRILYDGEEIGVEPETFQIRNDEGAVAFAKPYLAVSGTGNLADTYRTSALGREVVDVFAGAAWHDYVRFTVFGSEWLDAPWEGRLFPGSSPLLSEGSGTSPRPEYAGNPGYLHSARGDGGVIELYASEDALVYEAALGVASVGQIGVFRTVQDLGPWFVAGGAFDGFSPVANGTYSATMPPPDGWWS